MHPIRPVRVAACATIAIIALAAPSLVRAQALPSAKSLLEKHDAAVGGRAALDKHSSVHVTATLSIPAANVSGVQEEFRAKPNLFLSKQTFAGNEILSGYDGKTAWSITPAAAPGGGPKILDSAATAEVKAQAGYFSDYYDPAKIKSAETVELTDFQGQRCYEVKIVHKDDTELMIFFDSATGLRAGQSESSKVNGQEIPRTVVLTDYKDFGGVKMPTKRIFKLPMADVIGDVTSVEFDKLTPETFALPDAIKALVKP
jgi:hypothetical protein